MLALIMTYSADVLLLKSTFKSCHCGYYQSSMKAAMLHHATIQLETSFELLHHNQHEFIFTLEAAMKPQLTSII